ncbi:MAG: aspartate/glutamate racemase family protein [Burkholderiaceae bacterium]|nr:aspartate/glutamate racemase family protein [Burkholderiaceae bacterium]
MNTGFLGIVMLDTRFPRLPGDIGNPDSLSMPARRVVVAGAWPDKVVQSAKGLRAAQLLKPFVSVVRQLERDGAAAITTSCGFLVLLQRELQAAVHVPVVTSSLLLLPALLREQRQVGVLTISARRLGEEHLRSAGVPRERLADVLVQGVDADGEFAGAILGNRAGMDVGRASHEVVAAAQALKTRAPGLNTVVLECTNMPPYREAIEQATGLRVLSLLDSPVLRRVFPPD